MEFGLSGADLESRGLASYRWGGYRIAFSDLASFTKEGSFGHFLGGLTRGFIDWQDRSELLAILSILHEYAHFEQDVTSGLGHWDFYFRRLLRNQVFLNAQAQYDSATKPLRPLPDEKAQWTATMFSPLVRVDFTPQGRLYELKLLSRVLREELAVAPEVAADVAPHLTIQSILELDAVCAVYLTLIDLQRTVENDKELDAVDQFWLPSKMAAPYAGPFNFIFTELANQLAGEIDDTKIRAIVRMIQFLCGLSLAHPSPDWLRRHDQEAEDFHPGVRLMRMLTAPSGNKSRGLRGTEDAVRRTPNFEYPMIADIYRDWADVLREEGSASNLYSAIAEMRVANCEAVSTGNLRRRGGASTSTGPLYLSRSLTGFVDLDLPLLISRAGDRAQPMWLTGRAAADNDCMFAA